MNGTPKTRGSTRLKAGTSSTATHGTRRTRSPPETRARARKRRFGRAVGAAGPQALLSIMTFVSVGKEPDPAMTSQVVSSRTAGRRFGGELRTDLGPDGIGEWPGSAAGCPDVDLRSGHQSPHVVRSVNSLSWARRRRWAGRSGSPWRNRWSIAFLFGPVTNHKSRPEFWRAG